jgi:heat shock protein HslJ
MTLKVFIMMIFVYSMFGCKVQKNITVNVEVPLSVLEKEWIAVKIENEEIEQQLKKEQRPTIKLSEGKISGYASCNRFHGTYTVKENTIAFEQIAMTKMFCQETNKIENAYLKALSQVQSWEYREEKLYFFNQEKQIIIIFKEI